LLNTAEGITRLRGRWLTLENPWLAVPVAATALFHPAFLLRQSSFKREAWRDLLAIEHHLGAREER
jgi:DNA polymerase